MEIYRYKFFAMGGNGEVVIGHEDSHIAENSASLAIAEVLRIEKKYSRYLEDSIVSKINQSFENGPFKCDEETWALLLYADQLFKISDGLFDITSGTLRKIWDFKKRVCPSSAEIEKIINLIGWNNVDLSDHQIRLLNAGMELDFGGFGKEYAADCAANILSQTSKCAYINIGGDFSFTGPKPSGDPWLIGIQDPRNSANIVATIPVSSGGLATSGDYERYFEIDGVRYCHILNPKTGYPANYWQSVSVTAANCSVAGSCSTIALLHNQSGLEFLSNSGLDYLAINNENAFFQS